MLISTHREKLLNAIVFFAGRTHHCGKTKLFKLLYLLDFQHFRESGRCVTGMDYLAWKTGPVPLALAQEWDRPEPDMDNLVEIVPQRANDYIREKVVPRSAFDESPFSRRELKIMHELAARFADDFFYSMDTATHLEQTPWSKIWDNGRGNNGRIPYSLAIPHDHPHETALLEAARDYEAIKAANYHRH